MSSQQAVASLSLSLSMWWIAWLTTSHSSDSVLPSPSTISFGCRRFLRRGAYNTYLIERVRALSGFEVCVPENKIVEFKEALIFALLGVLRVEGRNNCLASVTGADRDHCSGELYE